MIVIKISADKPKSITISIRNEGVHEGNKSNEQTFISNNIVTLKGELAPGVVYGSDGNIGNGMKYESQIKVINDCGEIKNNKDSIKVNNANSVTLIMTAGTKYKNKYPTYRGDDPHKAVTKRIDMAIKKDTTL